MVTQATKKQSAVDAMVKNRKHERREGEAVAVSRMLRVSPRKLNLVARSIRGLSVDNAMQTLEFSRRRIALDVRKCLLSAIANAEENEGMDVDSLIVSEAHVGKNLVLRRIRARARGRFAPIQKPFSQLTVIVANRSNGGSI